MDKKPLIGVSICAVILLILASLSNVVGYQTVQSSNQTVIDNEVNQKEVLFQTILDIVNNKEIKGIIIKSQISKEGFFNRDLKFPAFKTPVLTMKQLKQMYLVGLLLSRTISKSKMHSILERYQVNNQGIQKEITAVIEKDATIKGELTQLSNSKCNCRNNSGVTYWPFPVICSVLGVVVLFFLFLTLTIGVGDKILETTFILGQKLNCWP
jgi:hypothetical protein